MPLPEFSIKHYAGKVTYQVRRRRRTYLHHQVSRKVCEENLDLWDLSNQFWYHQLFPLQAKRLTQLSVCHLGWTVILHNMFHHSSLRKMELEANIHGHHPAEKWAMVCSAFSSRVPPRELGVLASEILDGDSAACTFSSCLLLGAQILG